MSESPSKRPDTTSARKWSPPPVRSSTATSASGNDSSILIFSSSAFGIPLRKIPSRSFCPATIEDVVTLTDIAADKVRGFLPAEEQPEAGLRVGIKGGGCSGFQYSLALDEKRDGDEVFEYEGIRVLVDAQSLKYVDGSEVDYTESLMGAGFQVNNPNVVASCGCGSSFRVADEDPSCGTSVA